MLRASPPSDGGYPEVTLEIFLRDHPDTESDGIGRPNFRWTTLVTLLYLCHP